MASVLMAWRWYDWLALLLLLLSGLTAWALWRAPRPARPSAIVQRWFPLGALVFAGVVVLASVQAALFSMPTDSSSLAASHQRYYWVFQGNLTNPILDRFSRLPLTLSSPQWVLDPKSFSAPLLQFDGEKTYGQVADARLTLADSFTLTAWVKLDSLRRRQVLVQKADVQGALERAPVSFYVPWGEGRLGLVLSDGERRVGFLSDEPVARARWQFVAVTFEQTTGEIRFYADGQPIGSRVTSWRPRSALQRGPLLIGVGGSPEAGWHRFQGQLLSLGIYATALSPEVMAALAAQPLSPTLLPAIP